MRILFLVFGWLAFFSSASGQEIKPVTGPLQDTITIFTRDTYKHDFGDIPMENFRLFKYFRYTGPDSIFITRAWTSDPHFICKWPREPLINGKVYLLHFCFWHEDRPGKFYKIMGLDFSSGQRVSFVFEGNVINGK